MDTISDLTSGGEPANGQRGFLVALEGMPVDLLKEALHARNPGHLLFDASTKDLLEALRSRGGTLAAIAEAQLLVLKKSADYNQGGMAAQTDEAAAQANRDVYFPFGNYSYAQMIHTKAQRLNSLVMKESAGLPPNHEGIRDTLLDIINYASFWAERLSRESVA